MKLSEILAQNKKFASIEIVPPLKGVDKNQLIESVRPFIEFNPPFINVTCHRDEVEFKPNEDGSFRREIVRRRMSETDVCAAIMDEFRVEVVPHLICGGHSAAQIDTILDDFRRMGIDNILALRGDSLLGEKRFTPEPDGYCYASELVAAIKRYEQRKFCIGVGAYPEKHFEAPNLEQDILNLKKKVDAGADYIITQMFFDNKVFYSFVDKCKAAGISVPIIPGLKPLSSFKQVNMLPEAFSLDIPQDLAKEMQEHSEDREACYQIGIEWCSAQCEDLLANGISAIHFYTMGKADNIIKILSRHF